MGNKKMGNERSLRAKKLQTQPNVNFDKFLNDLKDATERGKKIVDVIIDIQNIKDILDAKEILDNKEIKPFGNYGAHIIVASKYAGKKAKVIIKK